jgi:adenylate cyclase
LLLSQQTFRHLTDPQQFHLRHLGSVRLKGKHNLLNVIECFDGQETVVFEKKLNSLPHFDQALQSYHQQDFSLAIELFTEMLAEHPEDLTIHYFLDNAIKYQSEGVGENWTGAEEMKYK